MNARVARALTRDVVPKLRQSRYAAGLVAALVVALALSACGGNAAESDADTLVIDISVTEASPEVLELNGLKVTLSYDSTDLLTPPGTLRPLLKTEAVITDGSRSKSIRAGIELRRAGESIDAYYIAYTAKSGYVKNEWIQTVSGDGKMMVSLIPNKTGPQRPGIAAEYITSATGKDFEFTLTSIEVADEPFTASNPVETPAPTFDSTPTGQFNRIALEKGWSVPRSFEATPTSADYETDPAKRPAAAMLSFIRQVNDWGKSDIASTSPTQIFSQWMASWDPEMLATGIDMLGDDQIKETFRRVQSGDIERWYGGTGTFVVGTGPNQIPPGTYRSVAREGRLITDGYWERTSRSGDIIDNNFITSAQEVTVTIEAGDGQFTTRGMGTWKPVG